MISRLHASLLTASLFVPIIRLFPARQSVQKRSKRYIKWYRIGWFVWRRINYFKYLLDLELRLCVFPMKFRASCERFRNLDDPVGRHFPRHGETFKMSAESQWCLSLCIQLFQNWRNGSTVGCSDICAAKLQMETYPGPLFLGLPLSSWRFSLQWKRRNLITKHACATKRVIARSSSCVERGEKKTQDAKRLRNFRNSFLYGTEWGLHFSWHERT